MTTFPERKNPSDKHARRNKKKSARQMANSGSPSASAYNPVSGTFHTLESVASESGTQIQNCKAKSVDEHEDQSNSNGVSIEYDSLSNISSCSGESEDQFGKEKQVLPRLGTPPGLEVGLDKRDKIRWKNEKKHQRQKERRAQELRDKCSGYLMSRKLEALAQQLVSMGFSSDSATMALILNEGHVEQSVSWLLEGGEGHMKEDLNTGGNLKINISDELTRLAEIESKYKYSRPEIERAVVSSEGDLEKAITSLHIRNSTSTAVSQDQNTYAGPRDILEHAIEQPSLVSTIQASMMHQMKDCMSTLGHQPQKNGKDINSVNANLQGTPVTIMERRPKEIQSSRSPNYINRHNQSPVCDERGMRCGRRLPLNSESAFSHSLVSPVVVNKSHSKSDSLHLQHKSKPESKSVHLISKQSSISALIPQSPNKNLPSSASSSVCLPPSPPFLSTSVWTSTFTSNVMEFYSNSTSGNTAMTEGSVAKQFHENFGTAGHYHPLFSRQLDGLAASWTAGSKNPASSDIHMSSSSLMSSSQSTSSNLYTGYGSALSGSPVDWNMGSIANCDYRNIDWSMAASPFRSAYCHSIWGLSSSLASLKSLRDEKLAVSSVEEEHQSISGNPGLVNSNKTCSGWIGSTLKGHNPTGIEAKSHSDTGNISTLPLHDWTSPFAGKDLFSLSHQAISSPTL